MVLLDRVDDVGLGSEGSESSGAWFHVFLFSLGVHALPMSYDSKHVHRICRDIARSEKRDDRMLFSKRCIFGFASRL